MPRPLRGPDNANADATADPNPYFDTAASSSSNVQDGTRRPNPNPGADANEAIPTATAITPLSEQPPQLVSAARASATARQGPTPAPVPAPNQGASRPQRPPSNQNVQRVQFTPLNRQQSAIRLRRLRGPGPSSLQQAVIPEENRSGAGGVPDRRHTSVDASRPSQLNSALTSKPLPSVPEAETPGDVVPPIPPPKEDTAPQPQPQTTKHHRFFPRRWATHAHPQQSQQPQQQQQPTQDDCYDSRIVDYLDVIDPEVATLSSITNVQNSLFVPSLGRWVNRRPTYDLSELPRGLSAMPGGFPTSSDTLTSTRTGEGQGVGGPGQTDRPGGPGRVHSFSTVLTDTQYAILPDDRTLEGWNEEDIKMLNDYVRHMLHSRRSKVKQRLKGFGKYVRRPLGFLVTLYATLITLFGLAWVLFLIGWIYVGERQEEMINIIDLVLVGLFAIVGDGMAPFRAVDTYHMIFVAYYHRKTWKLRQKLLLPDLKDHNDLPTTTALNENINNAASPSTTNLSDQDVDLEAGQGAAIGNGIDRQDQDPQGQQNKGHKKSIYETGDFPVLSPKEQAKLEHHQAKLAKSHTFYKPHETDTHHAFPLRLLIAVVSLLDLHSFLQMALGGVTWGYEYHDRPVAATTTLLCCSITVNCLAGLLIAIGDRRTRKKDVLERLLKQELTKEVMEKMTEQKQKEEADRERRERVESGEADGTEKLLDAVVSLPDKIRESTAGVVAGAGVAGGRRSSEDKRSSSVGAGRSKSRGGRKEKEGRRSSSVGSAGRREKERDRVGKFDPVVPGRLSIDEEK